MPLSFAQSLEQKQQQELRLSAKQLQSLHILQESAQELRQEIQTALELNPLLEISQFTAPASSGEANSSGILPGDGATAEDYDRREYQERLIGESVLAPAGDDYGKDLCTLSAERQRRDALPTGENHNDSEAQERRQFRIDSYSPAPNLYLLLLQQVHEEVGSDPVYEYLAGAVDENGYIQETAEEIAAGCSVTVETVAAKLKHFKEFVEPAGIGAATLRECLLLQLQRKKLVGSIEWDIIEQYPDLLTSRHYSKIAAKLELEPEEITDAVTRIKEELDPAPGKRLFADAAPTVLPDVTLTQNPDGQWKAAANRNIFPVLEVSTAYREYLESGSASQEDKKYIRGKQGEAQNLIDAIDYRLLTIEKIALALTVLQPEFFDGGKKEDLRPLTQNALAASLNFAESTVSRAMQDKYVATPWGTLPFRIFFPSAIRSGDGETVSSSKIRRRIREMIAAEDKRHPISDDDISKRLADEGFNVKRRTVAKYRDLEKIPATSARRER